MTKWCRKDIIIKLFDESAYTIARLCNGSTTDSDSVCLGSNPSRAANLFQPYFFEVWLSLVERCVRDAEAVGSNPVIPTIMFGQ